MLIGKGDLYGARLLVADQAVDPGIGDLDGDFVGAWLEGHGGVKAIGFVPDLAESLPLTAISARFLTLPRSIQIWVFLFLSHSAGTSMVLV